MRKANVLRLAAAHAEEPLRGRLLKDWTFVGQLTVGSGLPLTPLYLVPVPGTGYVGSKLIKGFYDAGINSSNTLIRDAMLNPDLARTLLTRASKLPDQGSDIALGNALMKNAVYGTTQAQRAGPAQ